MGVRNMNLAGMVLSCLILSGMATLRSLFAFLDHEAIIGMLGWPDRTGRHSSQAELGSNF